MNYKIKVGFLISYDYQFLFTAMKIVYAHVDEIILAVDQNRNTWSGEQYTIPSDFFEQVKAADPEGKVVIYEDDFYDPTLTAAQNDTRERNMLSAKMGPNCWQLQIDVDEYFLNFDTVARFFRERTFLLENPEKHSVNVRGTWVTLFKQTNTGFLYIDNKEHFTFATNVIGKHHFARDLDAVSNSEIFTDFVALHQSWAREPEEIFQKISNWSHKNDFDFNKYFEFWMTVNEDNYQNFVDLHPYDPPQWKSLKFIQCTSVEEFTEKYTAIHKSVDPTTMQDYNRLSKKSMNLLLDPQIFNDQKFGGISRSYAELYIEFNKMDGVKMECPIAYSNNMHAKELGLFQGAWGVIAESPLIPKFLRKKIIKRTKRANIRSTKKAIQSGDFDVFVPTYYSPYFLEHLNGKPFVLTVYDMIHELFPQYFTRDLFTVKHKKLLIEQATRIIAISENTKRDILAVYPHIEPSKIDVVYIAHKVDYEGRTKVALPEKYVLFVGNRTIYKNFLFFIRSVAPLLKADKTLFVVAAGGNKFNAEELQLIKELGIGNQVIQQNFEDNQLGTYYANAKCFIFASEYEGFGIPVLESMECGCPVVLANHSSFPEVAGDAGVYFELNNEADLREKISALVGNDTLRAEYIAKGRERVKKFSWAKTARENLEVYKKAYAEYHNKQHN